MEKENQLYEVEIKSQALLREDKKSFVTYFRGGEPKDVLMNARKLYPQYTNPEDKPVVHVNEITQEEYNKRFHDNVVYQRGVVLEGKVDISEIIPN